MSLGMILLVVLTLLILFGVLQRVLDRMALTDRQALFLVALILWADGCPICVWHGFAQHWRRARPLRRVRIPIFSCGHG